MPSLHRPALLIGLLAAACRAAPPHVEALAPGPAAPDTLCALISGPGPASGAARDTLSVALPEPVDPAHAPAPKNDTERLVFRQLYETLIRVDCTGRVLPGLARSAERSGRDAWTFTLRDEARFWDGAPVTTRDVLTAWRARDEGLAQSVTIIDEHTLTVRQPETPFQPFADPALAVSKPAPGGGWPIGTGAAPVPIGHPPPGAGLLTASAGSANGWNGVSGWRTVSVCSSMIVTLWARPSSRARQAVRTSRVVTGAPSQKRASSRSVKVHASRPLRSAERASPGSTRPVQSTRINVSYSCRKTNRSVSFLGAGAWAGSTGSGRATLSVSRAAPLAGPGPEMRAHSVSGAAGPGARASTCGGAARQAAASSPISRAGRCRDGMGARGSGIGRTLYTPEPEPGRC